MMTVEAVSTEPVQVDRANFLNLLIVDDDRNIREACRDIAQGRGFRAFIADSAEHAYRLLDSENIDVVLLDMKLPGASGAEALPQIRLHRPDAIIVVITGHGTVESAVQA